MTFQRPSVRQAARLRQNKCTGPKQWVVMVKPALWTRLDGETAISGLDRVLDVLPQVAEIEVDTQKLMVVEYQVWKAHVKAHQMEMSDG